MGTPHYLKHGKPVLTSCARRYAGRMKLALLWVAVAVVLAGCQRTVPDSDGRQASDTRAMGAASAPASAARHVASAPTGNASAGRAIALQGTPGAAACASCHGANFEGNAPSAVPRLAGLAPAYIEHQLNSFADGTRAQPVMTPIAGALSALQRMDVATYLASLGAAAPPAAAASAPMPAVVAGDAARAIPACASCHGASSNAPNAGPELAGQNAGYLASALASWKSGARHNDPGGKMPAIAKALTDPEAAAIAAYYAGLPASAARK
jgi:cytochrome c553